jgi:glutamate--cysteine ligase
MTFQQLLKEGFEGEPAVMSDWVDHLSTLFPEVRIKKVLEIRGADCVSAPLTGALAALWRGILYQKAALEEAERLLPRLTFAEHLDFHHRAGKFGMHANVKNLQLPRLAQQLVEIAARSLKQQEGDDASLLEPLAELAAGGRSPADHVLDTWGEDASRALDASEL